KLETRDSVIMDSVEVRHLARLNADGSLDSTFRFDAAANRFRPGGNGNVLTIRHDSGPHEGKFVVYGTFNQFDGVPAGRILRLNADGTVDETFNTGGTGADQAIDKLFYNATTGKYILAGQFRRFNGQPANRLAVLNEDGTLDESFVAKAFDGGAPDFAKQLSDGKIIVSGAFRSYDGFARNGLIVSVASCHLIPVYYFTCMLSGTIGYTIESTLQRGRPALPIHRRFCQFCSQFANNFIRAIIDA